MIVYPHQDTYPATIPFDLLGTGPLGWGYENATEHALAAITSWFNDNHGGVFIPSLAGTGLPIPATRGQRRRHRIPNIILLILTDTKNEYPDRIEVAWRKAWK
jgi:hypothetical protein